MLKTRSIALMLFAGLLLAGCCPICEEPILVPSADSGVCPALSSEVTVAPVSEGAPQGTDGYPWWNDTVFYTIFVRSFYDSSMDGVGDFNGVTQKLDYLQQLGVTGIYLWPIFPSPLFHGYNVTDLCAANPDYGTMDDFRHLLSSAHERGMRVILDMVFHDTSIQHPWFVEAARDPGSPYRRFYRWSEERVDDRWYASPYGDGYYFSQFGPTVAHLNIQSFDDEISQYMQAVTRFWLQDVGVDGFRLDAIRHLIPGPGPNYDLNTPETHAWLRQFHALYASIDPDAFMVGEVWGDPPEVLATYAAGDEISLTFEYSVSRAIVTAASTNSSAGLYGPVERASNAIPSQQYATFITINGNDRLMTLLSNDQGKARIAASMMLTLPGVPFLFFGEEIGMQGSVSGPGGCWIAEDIRSPMQWSSGCHAGFSTEITQYPPHPSYAQYNVADELNDPESLLNHYMALIRLRNEHPALRVGGLYMPETGNDSVFAAFRVRADEAILTLVNLSNRSISDYALSLTGIRPAEWPVGPYAPVQVLMGEAESPAGLSVGEYGFSDYRPVERIPPYATIILLFKPNP